MGHRRSTIAVLATGVVLAAPLVACSDSTGPDALERSDVAGSYEATTMETTEDGGDTVRLDQEADTFVRDMPFRAERASGGIRLVGDDTFGGVRIEVVLTEQ